jgi:ribosome-associated translation inhibitor RaiA
MQLPLQITMRGMRHSDALESAIRRRADKLEQLHPHIVSCRVVVEQQARHLQRGRQFVVRIDLKVPRREIAINHDHDKDVGIALRDAFAAARRTLEVRARHRRSTVKSRVPVKARAAD